MAKSEFSKEKLLALMDIFMTESDNDHHLTSADLIAALSQRGITAERKSIYADIALLQDRGWDILNDKKGYFLASRDFELTELKLLSDAVQCSRFITEKKSYELINKLMGLCSRHEATQLKRQVHLVGRSKASNEQIYYNVDAIYSAMEEDKEITFSYLEWHSDGKRYKKSKTYQASPYGLCWDSENYYLVAHTAQRGKTHYRVDKMSEIKILPTPRQNKSDYEALNMAEYSKQFFGMFGGQSQPVKLLFPEALADSAVDKFGADCMMIPQGDGTFTITPTVAVSPVFFSWVFSFGGRVKILSPAPVVEEYKAMCKKAMEE